MLAPRNEKLYDFHIQVIKTPSEAVRYNEKYDDGDSVIIAILIRVIKCECVLRAFYQCGI